VHGGTPAVGSTVQLAAAVGSEMRSRSLVGYVAVASPVGGWLLAGSTADPS